ncbi:hypothetical protein ACYZUD_08475 [Pseudomonas sp. XS1P51]
MFAAAFSSITQVSKHPPCAIHTSSEEWSGDDADDDPYFVEETEASSEMVNAWRKMQYSVRIFAGGVSAAVGRYAYLTSWLKVRFLAGKLSDVDIRCVRS